VVAGGNADFAGAGATGATTGGVSSFSVTISLWNLVKISVTILRWFRGWPGNFFIKLRHGTEG
jgi:hypothetical protein